MVVSSSGHSGPDRQPYVHLPITAAAMREAEEFPLRLFRAAGQKGYTATREYPHRNQELQNPRPR
jgi:hypothetical protein